MTIFASLIKIKLGDILKKGKAITKTSILIWVIVVILSIFICLGGTYAYFTSTARSRVANFGTATIRVGFSKTTTATVVDGTEELTSAKLYPGCTLKLKGSVANTGNAKIYAVVEFKVKVEGIAEPVFSKKYNAAGEVLVHDGTEYTTPATAIEIGGECPFEITYTFDFVLDNNYNGKRVSFVATAHAMQFNHVSSAVEATNILLN